ncbi:hypothetical protein NQL31_007029 [Lotmaria passim]
MDSIAELTGLVRRVSPNAYERLLLLFHYLHNNNSNCHKSNSSGSGSATSALSLQAICALLVCACPGTAPRFLFALAGNDKLLRSPDGGRTWRISFSRSCDDATPAHENSADAVDILGGMQRLLQNAAAADVAATPETELDAPLSSATTTGEAPTSASSAPSCSSLPMICDAHGHDDVVALCGRDGFLAISGDRGVTFTTATVSLVNGTTLHAALQHVRVVHSQLLVVSDDARQVFSVAIVQVGYGRLALGRATHVLTCSSSVVYLYAYTWVYGDCNEERGSRKSLQRAVVVSETNKLHVSLDGATTFLEVRHCMGQIRSMDAMTAFRQCEQPALPLSSLAAALEIQGSAASRADSSGGNTPATSSYAYISGYKRDLSSPDAASHATALAHFEIAARPAQHGVFYQHFFIAGNGTLVLPYDYTAVLCICTRRTAPALQSPCIVLSCATHVCYVPFSHARRQEALPCAVVRRIGCSGIRAGRGSTVGVSVSTDLEHWSTPQGAAPVGLVAQSGGELLACGRRKVVAAVGSAEVAHTVPSELRVPYLLTAFTM